MNGWLGFALARSRTGLEGLDLVGVWAALRAVGLCVCVCVCSIRALLQFLIALFIYLFMFVIIRTWLPNVCGCLVFYSLPPFP